MNTEVMAILMTGLMAMMSVGVAVAFSAAFGFWCWHTANQKPEPAPQQLRGSFFDLVKFGWVPIDRVGRVAHQAERDGYDRVWQYVGEKFAYLVYTSPQLTGAVAA